MHSIRQHTFGGPEVLVHSVVDDPIPGPGQVRIGVHAAGVHLLDTSIRAGGDGGALSPAVLPMTPGREVAGVVDTVGEGVDPSWVGRRAVAHLGVAGEGYAERAVVAAERTYAVPEGLDSCAAVAAIGTGRTAVGIEDIADLRPYDVVVVTSAAGGLGVLLVQACHEAGATLIAVAGGPEKLDLVARYGPAYLVDRLDDPLGAVAALPRPTLVLDAVGGAIGRAAHAALHPGGRLVRYGWTTGEENDYDRADVEVREVLGPAMFGRRGGLEALEAESLARAADGRRVPLVRDRFRLADAAAAHRALESGDTAGKVVLVTDASPEPPTR